LKGASSFFLHQISCSFKRPGATIYSVLEYLQNYKVDRKKPESWSRTQDEYESFIPRWEEQAAQAYVWLKAYQEEHFPSQEEKIL
jgi:hypothetical protein